MVCLDGSVYNLSATPDDGGWSGPGTMAGFAGWYFDPAVAGLGTHTLTYTFADGTESTCTVTVVETLAPFLSAWTPVLIGLGGGLLLLRQASR